MTTYSFSATDVKISLKLAAVKFSKAGAFEVLCCFLFGKSSCKVFKIYARVLVFTKLTGIITGFFFTKFHRHSVTQLCVTAPVKLVVSFNTFL